MRIVLIHPNYHSGGAEIAGNWPPAWVAYLTGYLKAGGYTDVIFVDAMTHHLSDEQVRERLLALQPDVVGCTAITPAIYKAEGLLQIAKEVNPEIVTVLGGIHGTFMYPQVLKEAPWIDAVVRGEGEQVFLNLVRAVDDGSWPRDRGCVRGIACCRRQGGGHAGRAADRGPRPHHARLGHPGLGQVHLHPDGRARGDPQLRARLPLHLQLLQPVEVLARLPHPRPEEGGRRDRGPGARTTRSASSSWPTRNRPSTARSSSQFCEELIARDLRRAVGHQHPRHRHPARREAAADVPQGRAGPRQPGHRGGGAAEAGPLQQGNHDRAEQEGDPAAARGRHRDRGAVHRRPGERDRRDAGRDLPDGARLEPRHGQLGDVHALAVQRPVPGARRQGRGLRLREVQLRHPDHEARRDGPRRAARPGDEQLPPLLHEQELLPVPVGDATSCGAST